MNIQVPIYCSEIFENSKELSMVYIGKEKEKVAKLTLQQPTLLANYTEPVWLLERGKVYKFSTSFTNNEAGDLGIAYYDENLLNSGIFIYSNIFHLKEISKISGHIYCFNDLTLEVGTQLGNLVILKN